MNSTNGIFGGMLILILALTSCTGERAGQGEASDQEESMHRQHESLQDNFAHRDIIILEEAYQITSDTRKAMKQFIQTYFKMKDAFFNDDVAGVDRNAKQMMNEIRIIEPQSMDGDGYKAWEQHASLYLDKLGELGHIDGLDEKRSYFGHISEILYCTLKSFGLDEDMELYAIYCPMAFDNKGAYWISDSRQMNNPYFGQKMPDCGRIEESL